MRNMYQMPLQKHASQKCRVNLSLRFSVRVRAVSKIQLVWLSFPRVICSPTENVTVDCISSFMFVLCICRFTYTELFCILLFCGKAFNIPIKCQTVT